MDLQRDLCVFHLPCSRCHCLNRGIDIGTAQAEGLRRFCMLEGTAKWTKNY